MAKNKIWSGRGREGKDYTILSYGTRGEDGFIVPEGSVIMPSDGSRPSWTTNNGSEGVSKGTGDDVPQAMLAVETFVKLSEEGEL